MKLILLLLVVLVFPLLLGSPYPGRPVREGFRLIRTWCMGWIVQYAVMFPLALAGIGLHWTLHVLTAVWTAVITGLSVMSLTMMLKRRDHPFRGVRRFIRETTFPGWLALVLVVSHAALTFATVHIDDDDSAYIGAATTSVDTDTLMRYDALTGNPIRDLGKNDMDRLVTAPQFAWYAAVSLLTGIRPAPLAHTFLPPFFTLLFFGAFALCGGSLFEGERRKTDCFCFLVFAVCAFSAVSIYTAGDFLMVRSWQGKAQAVGLIMPMVFVCLSGSDADARGMWTGAAELSLILTAGCLLTSMGGLLAAIFAAALLTVKAVQGRRVRRVLPMLPAFAVPAAALFLYLKI
ncbi:MAG: DUF6077 domain-containing protein [Clostridiales bacterium]|nr:DUF6077 domain-containing protein [Clostridiales bacterium]